MSSAKKRVVTAFLAELTDPPRILLALRSNSVSTFPGHWAGVSGYLEGDDAAVWALTEVHEETGVAPAKLMLRGSGKPLQVDDATYGGFQVHPFLFQVQSPPEIVGDWETARFEWVPVDELLGRRRQPVVPQLYEAFASVWPAWDDATARGANLRLSLDWLRRDRSLGAGSLARAAAREWLKQLDLGDPAMTADEAAFLRRACDELSAVRPAMVALANVMADVKGALVGGSRERLHEHVERLVNASAEAELRAAERAASRIPAGATVMVNSYSSTVRNALVAARERLARVIVCESRPLLEGRRLAAELAEAGLRVTLITDAQTYAKIHDVDLVLFGADAVLGEGSVVNKVGTVLVALAARHAGKRVVAVADTLKFVREGAEVPSLEENEPGEVWETPPPGVTIGNAYFEIVPCELIDEIVTEHDE